MFVKVQCIHQQLLSPDQTCQICNAKLLGKRQLGCMSNGKASQRCHMQDQDLGLTWQCMDNISRGRERDYFDCEVNILCCSNRLLYPHHAKVALHVTQLFSTVDANPNNYSTASWCYDVRTMLCFLWVVMWSTRISPTCRGSGTHTKQLLNLTAKEVTPPPHSFLNHSTTCMQSWSRAS